MIIRDVARAHAFLIPWSDDETDQKTAVWPPGLRGVVLRRRRAEPSAGTAAGGASAGRAAQRVAAAAGANCAGRPRGRDTGQHDP
jgi:hypothetical protein